MTIDPRFIEWPQWSALTASQTLAYADLPRDVPEQKWAAWATFAAGAVPAVAAVQAPLPIFYATWRDWALKFNEYVANTGIL